MLFLLFKIQAKDSNNRANYKVNDNISQQVHIITGLYRRDDIDKRNN